METDVFSGRAKLEWIYRQATQPPVRTSILGLGHELNSGKGQCLAIEGVVRAALRDAIVEHAELPTPHGGEQVAEAVVVADLRVLVVRRGVASLGGQEASPVDPVLPVRDAACRRRWW